MWIFDQKKVIPAEQASEWFADLFFPLYNACHLCGAFPERPGVLCGRCLRRLDHLRCKGLRIAAPQPHPPLAVCLSAYPHRHEARRLVHLFKYHSDTVLAGLLGEGMAAALASCPGRPQVDAVVPVPLHISRLEQRGYNQALLLAQAVCGHTGLELLPDALIRLHPTDTQLRRSRRERLMAMQHAFAVADASAIRGKRLLLVDDVVTTGATAIACAHALLQAGAAGVSLLTVCRA